MRSVPWPAAALLVVLAGCAEESSQAEPVWDVTASPVPQQTASARPAAAPSTGITENTEPAQPVSTSTVVTPPACPAAAIGNVAQSERILQHPKSTDGRATPLMATDVSLTNVSEVTCYLSGWPGVTLIGDGAARSTVTSADGTIVTPPPADHDVVLQQRIENLPGDAPVVTLRPGERTSFSVVHDGVTCLTPAWRTDLHLPGDDEPIEVARTGICNSDPVQVGPFGTVVDPT